MTSLRKAQSKVYWTEPSRDSLFREAFGLPDGESALENGEVHAILSLTGKEEAFSGKLYLSESYLTFASLDRKSCRLSLPLATVRRVEKLNPTDLLAGGAFALTLTLFHGLQIVLQLNSLRPTNDAFCAVLRTRLKASLPLMKSLKPFAKTFFSEHFLTPEQDEAAITAKEAVEIKNVGTLVDLGVEQEKLGEDVLEWTTESGTGRGFHGGLGLVFKFPGDAKKLREKSKMRLWKEYFQLHGRNLTLIRYPPYTRLVQVGLPNRLRGEIWEVSSGSIFLRLQNPGVYAQILLDNKNRTNSATEDIEKDLHRSLPEYAAYQSKRGIDTMRRVLTAYAFSNPAVGYCQAMNLVVASFLIFMSEEQCFWCLSILCDRLLPGYYSPSMYGTVLDQRVFENLVERCLPALHDHFVTADIQLSIASLPWFLSCYISAMPMIFAFRIVDNLFLNGPKVLFQIGLAILRINGEELLESTDDGMFINTIKAYFATLGDSAHPNSDNPRIRSITRFQELLVVAFREFASITDETIASERKRHRKAVVVSIETFAKRSTLRNLRFEGKGVGKDEVGKIYDHFQMAVLRARSREEAAHLAEGLSTSTQKERETEADSKPDPRIDLATFREFLGGIAGWARDEMTIKNGFHTHIERTFVSHHLIDRLFAAWDVTCAGTLRLQDIVTGLDGVMGLDLMDGIKWFFDLHDEDHDGSLTKEEVIKLSESLLFIFRNEPGDRYLGAVSNMLHNAFEYAESTKSPVTPISALPTGDEVDFLVAVDPPKATQSTQLVNVNPNRPYLGLPTFRMVILAEELLESFFDVDFAQSWKLEVLIAEEKPKSPSMSVVGAVGGLGALANGWFGGLMEVIGSDEAKEKLNSLADLAGRSLHIQTVEQKPSLGKLDRESAMLDPTVRGSLLARTNKALPPSPSVDVSTVPLADVPQIGAGEARNPWLGHAARKTPEPPANDIDKDISLVAAASVLDRPSFALDAVGSQEEEGEYDFGDEDEDEGLPNETGELKAQIDDFLMQEGV